METAMQGNRKRSLDALERRFAAAKAELLHQQRKKEAETNKESAKEGNFSPPNLPGSQGAKSSTSSTRKDVEVVDPTYAVLSQSMHENLSAAPAEISYKKGNRVDRLMHELLQKGDSAQKYTQGSRSMKVDGVILLDNYVKGRRGFVGSRVRALRDHSKRSKMRMSMKKNKQCGSFDLSQDLCRFQLFVPMHDMWKKYMTELLKAYGKNQLAQSLLGADLHGAIVQVADCKVASFSGANGIMISETAKTFGIVTRDDKFRVVPKKGSIFVLQVDSWKISLRGEKLIGRDLGL